MYELSLKERWMALINDLNEDQQRDLLDYLERQKTGYRKHKRKDCSVAADYIVQYEIFRDFIKNISAGGVYIRTKHIHYVGRDISMDFNITGHPKSIRVFGKIVRSDTNGFAVEFFQEIEELLDDYYRKTNGNET